MLYKITAFGEILWDVYPDKKRLGGAPFNFIYHILKIIGRANFISSVGNDENGKELLSILIGAGFDTKAISIDTTHPTGVVNVTLDENKVPHFKISDQCSFDFLSLNESTRKILELETDLIYFGTFTSRNTISRNTLLSLFNKPTKKYFCDLNLRHNFFTKELIEAALKTTNVLKINDYELEKLKEYFTLSTDDSTAVLEIIKKYNIDLVGLTLGKDGGYLFTKSDRDYYMAKDNNIVDTLGAGDAFAAILCLGYLHNLTIATINNLANEFALEICKINGAIPADESIYNKFRKVFK